jgi:hypothetical protein
LKQKGAIVFRVAAVAKWTTLKKAKAREKNDSTRGNNKRKLCGLSP